MKIKLLFSFICLGFIGSNYSMDDKTLDEIRSEIVRSVLKDDPRYIRTMSKSFKKRTDVINELLKAKTLQATANINNKDEFSWTILMRIAAIGNEDIAKLLLDNGANPNIYNDVKASLDDNDYDDDNDDNDTALTIGIRYNHAPIVKILLENGANPNLQNNVGITSLMITANNGNQDIAKLLLDNGANPNIYDNNNDTALTLAIRFNHVPIVKLLLENGANPDYQDESGITHLMWAVRRDNKPVVKLLLDHGADLDIKNIRKGTALDIAKKEKNKSIVELIENEYEKRRQQVHKEVVENSCLLPEVASIVSEYVVYPKKEKTK